MSSTWRSSPGHSAASGCRTDSACRADSAGCSCRWHGHPAGGVDQPLPTSAQRLSPLLRSRRAVAGTSGQEEVTVGTAATDGDDGVACHAFSARPYAGPPAAPSRRPAGRTRRTIPRRTRRTRLRRSGGTRTGCAVAGTGKAAPGARHQWVLSRSRGAVRPVASQGWTFPAASRKYSRHHGDLSRPGDGVGARGCARLSRPYGRRSSGARRYPHDRRAPAPSWPDQFRRSAPRTAARSASDANPAW